MEYRRAGRYSFLNRYYGKKVRERRCFGKGIKFSKFDWIAAAVRGIAKGLFTRAHLYTVAGAVRPAGGIAYFVRDGKLRSPNPLCALRRNFRAGRDGRAGKQTARQ